LPARLPAGEQPTRHLFPFSVPSFSRESAITFQPLLSLRKNAGRSSKKEKYLGLASARLPMVHQGARAELNFPENRFRNILLVNGGTGKLTDKI